MTRRVFSSPSMLSGIACALLATAAVDGARSAPATGDDRAACLEHPGEPSAEGLRWRFHFDRANARRCWYLAGGEPASSRTQGGSAPSGSPSSGSPQPDTPSFADPALLFTPFRGLLGNGGAASSQDKAPQDKASDKASSQDKAPSLDKASSQDKETGGATPPAGTPAARPRLQRVSAVHVPRQTGHPARAERRRDRAEPASREESAGEQQRLFEEFLRWREGQEITAPPR